MLAPDLLEPQETATYMNAVPIRWTIPETDPYDDTEYTFEIEYTTHYDAGQTIWHTLKRRIPFTTTSYTWKAGKLLQSNAVRVRIRAKAPDESASEWSFSSSDFSVNFSDCKSPAIVNPVPNVVYSDYILVILDESGVQDTFGQRCRVFIDYANPELGIDWTAIASNLVLGQTVVRWDITALTPSDAYVVRVLASNGERSKNSYVYGIRIHSSGSFIIDTTPPEAILEIQGTVTATNEQTQVVNIYAVDAVSEVASMQLRECDASDLMLNPLYSENNAPNAPCESVEQLLSTGTSIAIGKSTNLANKTIWEFSDISGLRKLEGLFVDSGGNPSIATDTKVFSRLLSSAEVITDICITKEAKTYTSLTRSNELDQQSSIKNVIYAAVSNQVWKIDDVSQLQYSVEDPIVSMVLFFGRLYFCTYDESSDEGNVYRHDGYQSTLINSFASNLSKTLSATQYGSFLFLGLQNGELWKFNGNSFSLLNSFSLPVTSVAGDGDIMVIGLGKSDEIYVYDGTTLLACEL